MMTMFHLKTATLPIFFKYSFTRKMKNVVRLLALKITMCANFMQLYAKINSRRSQKHLFTANFNKIIGQWY